MEGGDGTRSGSPACGEGEISEAAQDKLQKKGSDRASGERTVHRGHSPHKRRSPTRKGSCFDLLGDPKEGNHKKRGTNRGKKGSRQVTFERKTSGIVGKRARGKPAKLRQPEKKKVHPFCYSEKRGSMPQAVGQKEITAGRR